MVDEFQTKEEIKKIFNSTKYILDPHGAVGYGAAQKALNDKIITHDMPLVSLACAHPAKFPDIISKAINIRSELPTHLKFIMSSEENFQIIDPSVLDVQHFIKSNVRLI